MAIIFTTVHISGQTARCSSPQHIPESEQIPEPLKKLQDLGFHHARSTDNRSKHRTQCGSRCMACRYTRYAFGQFIVCRRNQLAHCPAPG